MNPLQVWFLRELLDDWLALDTAIAWSTVEWPHEDPVERALEAVLEVVTRGWVVLGEPAPGFAQDPRPATEILDDVRRMLPDDPAFAWTVWMRMTPKGKDEFVEFVDGWRSLAVVDMWAEWTMHAPNRVEAAIATVLDLVDRGLVELGRLDGGFVVDDRRAGEVFEEVRRRLPDEPMFEWHAWFWLTAPVAEDPEVSAVMSGWM